MTRFSSSIRRDEIEIIWPISFRIYVLVGLIDYTVGVVGVRISLFDNDFVNEHDEEDGAAKERTKTKKNRQETATQNSRFVATKHREENFSFIGMSKLLMEKRAIAEY